MDIERCREFLLLSSRLNFTEAANELNMTQPALSKHIHALEKEFGASFFDRSHRNLQLTEAGRIFSENAAAIVECYDRTKEMIALLAARRPLRIAGHFGDMDISSFASTAALIAREKYGTHTTLKNIGSDQYDIQLANDEIDAFIGYIDEKDLPKNGVSAHVFTMDPLIAIMNAQHSLASKSLVTLEDLATETLLHCSGGTTDSAWNQIMSAFEREGITPRVRHVPCENDIACFTTPLSGSILLWKRTYREIKLLTATKHRAIVPVEEKVILTTHIVYAPETEPRLQGFLDAVKEARAIMYGRKKLRQEAAQ